MDRYLFLSAMPWAYELSASDSFVINRAVDHLYPLLFEVGSSPSQDAAAVREADISISLKSTGLGSSSNLHGDDTMDSAMKSNIPNPGFSAVSVGLSSYNTLSLCMKRAACCVVYGGKLIIFSGGESTISSSSSSTTATTTAASANLKALDPAQIALEIYVLKHVRSDGCIGTNGQHSIDSTNDNSNTYNSNSSEEARDSGQNAFISAQEALKNSSNNNSNSNSNSAGIEPPPCLIFRLDDKFFAIDHRDITSLRQPRGPNGGLSPAAQVTSSFLVFSDGMELRIWSYPFETNEISFRRLSYAFSSMSKELTANAISFKQFSKSYSSSNNNNSNNNSGSSSSSSNNSIKGDRGRKLSSAEEEEDGDVSTLLTTPPSLSPPQDDNNQSSQSSIISLTNATAAVPPPPPPPTPHDPYGYSSLDASPSDSNNNYSEHINVYSNSVSSNGGTLNEDDNLMNTLADNKDSQTTATDDPQISANNIDNCNSSSSSSSSSSGGGKEEIDLDKAKFSAELAKVERSLLAWTDVLLLASRSVAKSSPGFDKNRICATFFGNDDEVEEGNIDMRSNQGGGAGVDSGGLKGHIYQYYNPSHDLNAILQSYKAAVISRDETPSMDQFWENTVQDIEVRIMLALQDHYNEVEGEEDTTANDSMIGGYNNSKYTIRFNSDSYNSSASIESHSNNDYNLHTDSTSSQVHQREESNYTNSRGEGGGGAEKKRRRHLETLSADLELINDRSAAAAIALIIPRQPTGR